MNMNGPVEKIASLWKGVVTEGTHPSELYRLNPRKSAVGSESGVG
jgi:hypothetical protein